jgi:hypothetical protein
MYAKTDNYLRENNFMNKKGGKMLIISIILLIFALMMVLSKNNDTANDFVRIVSKEWTKPRTIFTSMFYGVYLFLILRHIPIPAELNTIISTLFGFWFGQMQSKKEGEQK